ncbi:Malonyl CoA-acyl carrier protein transacylase [Actinomadura rubteroloni]|uniref:Malonyl CoA-acyl carrier protein transacylase n=1 Tax=Actinomadura rubteroloni TaxID=1926885 RepID=A0A2P4UDI3_9ACTN|nr:acyltransferase domain-containing protein [Actinomadura rubteroloni]POM23109.1 Malonyl CoA-acyl carrier protein transacylase [Actinomadura rubteroloni]
MPRETESTTAGPRVNGHGPPGRAIRRGTAVIFPGQGAYRPGILHELRTASPDSDAVLEEISAALDGGLDKLLGGDGDASAAELAADAPDLLQAAIFAASVGLWAARRRDLPDDAVLLGHSLGEIAAATCAGAFSISDGARVLQARNEALMDLAFRDGGMVALGLDAARASALIHLADDPTLAVACRNAPDQTVVSGSSGALVRVGEIARALAVPAAALPAPFPFHGPRMAPVVARHRELIRDVPQRPLSRNLYSTLHHRHLTDADDVRATLVDQELVTVDFLDAVRTLHAHGVRDFVECGAGEIMSKVVRRSVPSVDCRTWDEPREDRTEPQRPTPAEPTDERAAAPDEPRDPPPEDVLDALRSLYAEVLGYPVEVMEDDSDLEADLGVDSLKQTELLVRAAGRFGLPNTNDLKVSDFPTLAHVAEEVRRRLDRDAR